MPNHPTAPLASGAINASGDTIEVVLVQPADTPSVIMIRWPDAPTIADPRRFPDTAATIARLFAEAATKHQGREAAMNGAEALAEARRTHAAQLARNPEIDDAHLKWLQENPDAVWKALTRE